MPKKKRLLTLIEVIIAFALAAILFSFILTSFFQHIKISKNFEIAKKEVLARAYLQKRLTTIFLNKSKERIANTLNYINDTSPRLEFTFNNGIDPDRSFTDQVTGLLYLKNSDLCLKIFGKGDSAIRKEVLFTHVKKIEFNIYDEGEKPLFFILSLTTLKGKEISFPVFLRVSEKGITFNEKV